MGQVATTVAARSRPDRDHCRHCGHDDARTRNEETSLHRAADVARCHALHLVQPLLAATDDEIIGDRSTSVVLGSAHCQVSRRMMVKVRSGR
jgi:hypothetical protein